MHCTNLTLVHTALVTSTEDILRTVCLLYQVNFSYLSILFLLPCGCPQGPSIKFSVMTSRSAIEHVESGPRLSSTVIHKGIVYTAGIVCEVGGEGKDMRRENFPSVLALAD